MINLQVRASVSILATLRLCLCMAGLVGCTSPSWKSTNISGHTRTSLFQRSWQWLDEQGDTRVFADWRGTPLVIATIYTNCHEMCPRTLGKLWQVYEQFQRQARPAAFVLITLDSAVDTPQRLLEFKTQNKLPAAWHLLVGDEPTTDEFMSTMGIHVMRLEDHRIHDSKIMLFDGEGRSASELQVL